MLGAGHQVPGFAEFWAAGEYRLPGGPEHFTLFADFRADPVRSPLRTPSGRIEITSETIAGFGYADCPGHPVWLEPDEWLGAPLARRFPLHLIANQPATRLHSQLDIGATSQQAKVAGREAIQMHPAGRGRPRHRGRRRGPGVQRPRRLPGRGGADHRDPPGVVRLPTGAWFDPVPGVGPAPLCAHGNPNVLTADVPSSRLSQGCAGQHALVEIERWAGQPPPVTVGSPPPLLPAG